MRCSQVAGRAALFLCSIHVTPGGVMTSPFAVTAAATSVVLAENRLGEMQFTVTNMTDQPVRAKASVVPLDSAPPEWFSIVGKADLDLRPRASTRVLVQVEPPLGVPPGRHLFRVDVANPALPDVAVSEGPSCEVVVPPSQIKVNPWKVPRGYLATLVGATAGGALGELVVFLSIRGAQKKDCTTIGCAVGDAIGQAILLFFAILVGLALLWVGSVIGAWLGLRVRRYLGSKLTALFLAVLMIPWTCAMGALLTKVTNNLTVLAILAPILLTAVPGALARGAVLLIRTRHL
jgi:hypothetical protein